MEAEEWTSRWFVYVFAFKFSAGWELYPLNLELLQRNAAS